MSLCPTDIKKDMEHPIEIVNEDGDGKSHTTVDDGDRSGSCLCLLKIVNTVAYI